MTSHPQVCPVKLPVFRRRLRPPHPFRPRARAPKLTMALGISLLKGCLALQSISQLAFSFAVIRVSPGRVTVRNSSPQLLQSATRVSHDDGGSAFVRSSRHFSTHQPLLGADPTTATTVSSRVSVSSSVSGSSSSGNSSSGGSSSSSAYSMSASALSEAGAHPRWEEYWSAGVDVGDKWDTGTVSPALQKLLDEGMQP